MPGRKSARRLGVSPGSSSSKRRGAGAAYGAALALGASLSNCSFPDYGFSSVTSAASSAGGDGGMAPAVGGSGSAGSGGSAGRGGSSGSVGGGGPEAGSDDAGAAGVTGGAGSTGGEPGVGGSGGEPCVFPKPLIYPAHCFNHSADNGESGTDCGGSECAPCSSNQACTQNSDCLSQQCATNKTCVPLISFSYAAIEIGALTPMPKFRLNISYLDTRPMSLNEFSVRYYYNHNSVAEPIAIDAQVTIDPGGAQTDISNKVLASVHRFPLGPKDANGFRTDSYLEITFNDSRTVINGTKFVITEDFFPGTMDSQFDQNSHYSFVRTTSPVASETIAVFRGGQRVWGVEPPLATFPACAFEFGVNMNGPALTVAGEPLLAESDAQFTFMGGAPYSSAPKPLPTTDAKTTSLLGTGRTLSGGDSALRAVPNGAYWAYAWLTSSVGSDSGTLMIGESAAEKFYGSPNAGGAHWALLGPYRVDVLGNSLKLAVDGSVHLAGVKLYEVER